jgi:FeS assembly SUF system regulator
MLRISRLTDYATVVLATLAEQPERVQTATSLAEQTRIAAPTVSKLLKQLQRANLVTSTRGLHGGYQLARPAAQISAAAILDALEGPMALTDCAAGPGSLRDRGDLPRRPRLATPEPCHSPLLARRQPGAAGRHRFVTGPPAGARARGEARDAPHAGPVLITDSKLRHTL